ncbi:MAG: zinc-ribbon and DUF3426 domain-containing protein [Proteobacteria bacterium]|nr:zinc-ribbon and DUF3426 domain-containing protein [Pseudomonadota bacterium]
MKGTTRCPHCETRFKISEAQFVAHQGMVRCGHCMQAFDSRPTFIPEQQQSDLLINAVASDTDAAEHVNTDEVVPEVPATEDAESSVSQTEVAHDISDSTVAHADDNPVPITPDDSSEYLPLQSDVIVNEVVHDDEISHDSQPVFSPDEMADHSIQHENVQDAGDIPLAVETANELLHESDVRHDESLDFSHLTGNGSIAVPHDAGDVLPEQPDLALAAEHVKQDDFEDEPPVASRRNAWPWFAGISISILLLMAQSAYFFRIGLAARLPVIKPALAVYCHLLNCSVPLPQNAELISIESSGLEAEPEHENQITLSALLRNRASYSLSFPVLALTLNDNQDKPMARRFFMPADYLPADESAQAGFLNSHEVSVKLRLNTADLRPSGYRLELFYRHD